MTFRTLHHPARTRLANDDIDLDEVDFIELHEFDEPDDDFRWERQAYLAEKEEAA